VIAELKKEMSAPEKQIDEAVFLDPDQKSPRAQDFEERLSARIVGQERAVRRMSGLYQNLGDVLGEANGVGTICMFAHGPPGPLSTQIAQRIFGSFFCARSSVSAVLLPLKRPSQSSCQPCSRVTISQVSRGRRAGEASGPGA
jgi:hypothetical protein